MYIARLVLPWLNFAHGKLPVFLSHTGRLRFSSSSVITNPPSMASQKRRPSLSLPGSSGSSSNEGILARFSNSVSNSSIVHQGMSVAADTAFAAKKLLRSTGKAAWIAGTTFLILVVPLIIEMDREQQMNDLEMQQASLLGTPAISPPQ